MLSVSIGTFAIEICDFMRTFWFFFKEKKKECKKVSEPFWTCFAGKHTAEPVAASEYSFRIIEKLVRNEEKITAENTKQHICILSTLYRVEVMGTWRRGIISARLSICGAVCSLCQAAPRKCVHYYGVADGEISRLMAVTSSRHTVGYPVEGGWWHILGDLNGNAHFIHSNLRVMSSMTRSLFIGGCFCCFSLVILQVNGRKKIFY